MADVWSAEGSFALTKSFVGIDVIFSLNSKE